MVNMNFQKFSEFLKNREIDESYQNKKLNRSALDYDKRLAQFNGRFKDPQEADGIIRAAGYATVGAFVNDPDERKWSKLKMPGQQNYVR